MAALTSLNGVRVLDMTHVLAGPYCAYQLALLGADVVKIEDPSDPDMARGRGSDPQLAAQGLGLNFQTQAGNKRAIALNLKSPEGVDLLKLMVAQADVLIENYRPGALVDLGLGADVLRALNPRLIYCSITGFGQDGLWARAYDNTIQATTGIMARTGTPDQPLKAGASMVDYATGMAAAFAISSALYEREQTGVGRVIDCAMFNVALTFLAPEAASSLHEGEGRATVKEAGLGCYATQDGHLMLGAFNVRQNHRLWTALGDDAFASLKTWEELWAAAPAMRKRLAEVLMSRTAQQWEEVLQGCGVPAAKVLTLDETVRSQPAQAFLQSMPAAPGLASVMAPRLPFKMDGQAAEITRRAPRVGEHTDEVLAEYGLTQERLQALRATGVLS